MTSEDEEKIEEGRKLLEALGCEVAGKPLFEIMRTMAAIGLEYLRAVKLSRDDAKMGQAMHRRIMTGPRPTSGEATQN